LANAATRMMLMPGRRIIVLAILMFSAFSAVAENVATQGVIWQLDFSQLPDKDHQQTIGYLKSLGFEFGIEAEGIKLEIKDGRLNFSTLSQDTVFFALRFQESEQLAARRAEIIWGVQRFAQGANWEKNNNRVAIASLFVLGSKNFSSGLPFGINSAPYFLSPFIGEKETVNKIYKGRLYREAGRYICDTNQTGRIKTDFNISKTFHAEFKKHYKKPGSPPVTAIGFQMNTKDTRGGAEAFIESVRLYN